jgi:hypothetical protein
LERNFAELVALLPATLSLDATFITHVPADVVASLDSAVWDLITAVMRYVLQVAVASRIATLDMAQSGQNMLIAL